MKDTQGNELTWAWGLAGSGMNITVNGQNIWLDDNQLETFVRVLCKKCPGEYVPHGLMHPRDFSQQLQAFVIGEIPFLEHQP